MRIALALVLAVVAWAQPRSSAGAAGQFAGGAELDRVTEEAIREGYMPGAVLLVGHNGQVVFRKAYGSRALVPQKEAATLDTIYDAASLTKVIATTPAMMKLFEQGRIRLADPVTAYLPEFQGGSSSITIQDLMTHFSGLRPDLDLEPAWSGYETGIRKALTDKPTDPPGTKFVYSDINFELLGEIVRRVSGKPLNEFVREQIYQPLGMKDTGFLPAAALRPRIAPTEIDSTTGQPLRGVVHDPTARYMGGVAGHAGVFTTADDLAIFCQMMLNKGEYKGVRIFAPATVDKFTARATPISGNGGQNVVRGLGWDIDSPYSSNRGEIWMGGFGHTGFTGPAIWIHPETRSYVVIMANRNHPKGGRSINSWRSKVATIVAATISRQAQASQTSTGLDVWASAGFAPLKGKKVGLITNQTGIDRQGKRNIDLMRAAGVNLITLFSPEHGIAGAVDTSDIADSVDKPTGLPVRSLYGNGRTRVTSGMFTQLDSVVFDMQDVGARFYTYGCAMLYAIEEAAKAGVAFYVLDRPNPVTGGHVEGPVLDEATNRDIACYTLPVRHGMTLGEIATMANEERGWKAKLDVVRMENWTRDEWFDQTGLPWIDPSPNMRGLNAATLYPGIALIESMKDYSVGRGTDAPFEQVGAEWIDGPKLASYLNARGVAGVGVYPVIFAPTTSVGAGKKLGGVRFIVTERESFDAVRFGIEVASALKTLYPAKADFESSRNLIGSRAIVDALKSGEDTSAIAAKIQSSLAPFLIRREKFLLY